MKKIENLLIGAIFIILGVILGLNAMDITDIDIFFDGWWTLFIIIPCFFGLLKDEEKTGNLIGLVIGVALLLSCQDLLEFEMVWKLMIPFILIMIGLSILFKDVFNKKVTDRIKEINNQHTANSDYMAVFSSKKLNYDNQEFDGSTLSAIFGGVKLDLREAHIARDVVINATCIFGGIDIYVPDYVDVKMSATSLFGGVGNKRKNTNVNNQVTVYINSTCIFGGVDIK